MIFLKNKNQWLHFIFQLVPVSQAALEMGFSRRVVRQALETQVQTTGLPFFSLETCTEKVLGIVQEEGDVSDDEVSGVNV